jgi:glyoxylase-like metal-dependent hydrolase (beta-lactamase superfamily II)
MNQPPSRRDVLQSGSYLALALIGWERPSLLKASQSPKILDRQPFGYLQELSEGIYAVLSTPLVSSDWTTGCNGGLIVGEDRILAVESFVKPVGAEWLADQAEKLTGRRPSDVLVTHFHGDHANGLEGYNSGESARIWATRTTLDLIREEDAARDEPPSDRRLAMLEGAKLIENEKPTTIDLGGRTVTLHPRRGHTASDVTAEIDEPSIVFAGDLVWNGMFPNYRDTEVTGFTQSIRALHRDRETTYISGHGELADSAAIDTLLTLVESIESAARKAHGAGIPLAEAAASYELPSTVADWVLFNPKYFEVAFKAWYQELG